MFPWLKDDDQNIQKIRPNKQLYFSQQQLPNPNQPAFQAPAPELPAYPNTSTINLKPSHRYNPSEGLPGLPAKHVSVNDIYTEIEKEQKEKERIQQEEEQEKERQRQLEQQRIQEQQLQEKQKTENPINNNSRLYNTSNSPSQFAKPHLHSRLYSQAPFPGTHDPSSRSNNSNNNKISYAEELKRQLEQNEAIKQQKKREEQARDRQAQYDYLVNNPIGKNTGGGAPIYNQRGQAITKVKGVLSNHLVDYESTEMGQQVKKSYYDKKKNIWKEDDQNMMDKMFENQNRFQSRKSEINQQFYQQQQIEKDQQYQENQDQQQNQLRQQKDIKQSENQEFWDKQDKNMLQVLAQKELEEKQNQLQQRQEYFQEIAQQVAEKKRKKELEKQKELEASLEEDRKIKQQLREMSDQFQKEKEQKQRQIDSSLSKIMVKQQENKKQKFQEQDSQFQEEVKAPNSSTNPLKQDTLDYEQFKTQQEKEIQEEKQQQQQQQLEEQKQQQDNNFNIQNTQNPDNTINQEQQQQQLSNSNRFTQQQQRYGSEPSTQYNQGFQQQQPRMTEQDFKKQESLSKVMAQKKELDSIQDQLNNQQSILQNEVRNLKREAMLAAEQKRNAINDLSNLKEELKKQQIVEQLRYKEMQMEQHKYNQLYHPYDYLVKNNVLSSQNVIPDAYKDFHQSQQQLLFKNSINNANLYNINNSSLYPPNNNNQNEKNPSKQNDILDTLVNTSQYAPYKNKSAVSNSNINNNNSGIINKEENKIFPEQGMQSLRTPALQNKIESTVAQYTPSLLDNNIQQIDNILLNLKNEKF